MEAKIKLVRGLLACLLLKSYPLFLLDIQSAVASVVCVVLKNASNSSTRTLSESNGGISIVSLCIIALTRLSFCIAASNVQYLVHPFVSRVARHSF
jgi:hypothetical protein